MAVPFLFPKACLRGFQWISHRKMALWGQFERKVGSCMELLPYTVVHRKEQTRNCCVLSCADSGELYLAGVPISFHGTDGKLALSAFISGKGPSFPFC